METIETVKPSLKERQWKLREDAILDASSELMVSKGYNAMTMDDIANLVGISKATLYQHFSSKHDLVVSVACRTSDRAFEKMSSIDPDLPPQDRISFLIDRIVEVRFGGESPPVFEAVGEFTDVLGSDHPYMKKELRNQALICDAMHDAEAAGVLIPGLSIAVAVSLVLATLRCVDLERSLNEGGLQIEQIADSLKRMVLRANPA